MSEILPLPPGSTQQPPPAANDTGLFPHLSTGHLTFIAVFWAGLIAYMVWRLTWLHWVQLFVAGAVGVSFLLLVGDVPGAKGGAAIYGGVAAFLLTLALARLGDWYRRRQDRH